MVASKRGDLVLKGARPAAVLVSALALAACCTYPTAAPANGSIGASLRVIDADRASARPAIATAALIDAPSPGSRWPPPARASSGCTDEVETLSRSFGVAKVGCPAFQQSSVPEVVDDDAPIAESGFALTCFPLGSALLVVESTSHFPTSAPASGASAAKCTKLVGLTVFPLAKQANP